MNDIIDFNVIDEQGPQRYHSTYEMTAAELGREEVAAGGNIAVDATIQQGHAERDYIATGTVSFSADLLCSRCVEPYPFAIVSPFHVTFRPRPDISSENEEIEITDKSELDVEFYSERRFPLRNLGLEQVQLSIPMKPLCEDDCLGLCAKCGANRLRERCGCDESVVDQRWDALQGIKDELSKKKSV